MTITHHVFTLTVWALEDEDDHGLLQFSPFIFLGFYHIILQQATTDILGLRATCNISGCGEAGKQPKLVIGSSFPARITLIFRMSGSKSAFSLPIMRLIRSSTALV
jgi:hypothetical protein